jgi:hypothetical protein
MATKMTVFLKDDLEGGPADETVRLGTGGTADEMDPNAQTAAALRRQPALTPSTPTGLAEHTAAAGADCVQPGTERGHPGVGKDQGIALSDCGPSPPASTGDTEPHGRTVTSPEASLTGPIPGGPWPLRPVNDARLAKPTLAQVAE